MKSTEKEKGISDEFLLDLILFGEIVIKNINNPLPDLYVRGRKIKAQLMRQGGKQVIAHNGHRYRWDIRWYGRRRNIQCSRLVWMFVHKEVIGDDIIHHGPGGKLDNSIGNLSRLSEMEHKEIHYGNGEINEILDY